MSRRVRMPASDELFRPTAVPEPPHEDDATEPTPVVELAEAKPARGGSASRRATAGGAPARTPSGRVRHDEKMTVYITSDELLDLEQARLELRRTHGLAVDRGRLVRAAVAMALAELDEQGADSRLVQRLREA